MKIRIVLLACLGLVAAVAAAAQEVRVYRPTHRTALELLPPAKAALGEADRVEVDRGTNTLVLSGAGDRLDVALTLLQELDVARRVVVLEYASRELVELETSGIQVEWTGASSGFRIGNTVTAASRPGSKGYRSHRERAFDGAIRVLEGETATLARGREVPVQSRDLFGRGTVEFTGSDQGFRATPRVLGDGRIQIEIAPDDSRTDDSGHSERLTAGTIVVLRPGETVAVAGASRQRDHSTARPGRSISTRQGEEQRVLLLTATVEP